MGVARGPGDAPRSPAREEALQRYKRLLQAAVVAYVVFYAILYKNSHMQKERATGTVDVGAWPGDLAKDPSTFADLPYCDSTAYWLEGGCSSAQADTARREAKYGAPRFEAGGSRAGEVVCCSLDGSSSTRKLPNGDCISGGEAGRGHLYTWYEAKSMCDANGMRLCYSAAELDRSCSTGCRHDEALVWTATQGVGNGQRIRCEFINELDVLSFDAHYTFIPTHVTVVRQKASCAEGQDDISRCKLDYKTDAESLTTLDEYWIGNVEDFQLSLGHTFHSDITGDGTMFDAERVGLTDCDDLQPSRICRDTAPGGHDQTSLRRLLQMLSIDLESNNDATDHPNHTEPFRSSGLKIHIGVHYSNMPSSWWSRADNVRYEYKVHVTPAEGVWHGLTLKPVPESLAWLSMAQLRCADLLHDTNDRVIVWADGVEIRTHLAGQMGQVEPHAWILTLASALPLLFFARNIVELLCGQRPAWGPGGPAGPDEEAEGEGGAHGAAAQGEAGGPHGVLLRAGGAPLKAHEGTDGL